MPEASIAGPRRQLSAILFADVHGYSRLMASNEERTYQRVTQAIRLIGSLIGDYGGRIQHVAGDGILALFESAAQALQFAIAIQREFREEALLQGDDDPIAFRIGINVGHVFFGGEANIQGHSVNVAARIQALARPGGICITDAVERAVRDTLGVPLRRLGRRFLKNITEPVEVFAIDINGPGPAPTLMPAGAGSLQTFRPVIAVEPFRPVSGGRDDTQLAFAMSEALIQALCRFNWLAVKEGLRWGLITPAIGSSFAGGPDADYLVAGRVIRLRRSVRLLARLRELPDGRIIWSSGAALTVGRTFKQLNDLAAVLAARLDRQILMAEVAKAWQRPLDGLDPHDYVMRAIPLMFQMSKDSLREAEQLLRAADEPQQRSSRNQALRAFAALLRFGQQWASDPGTATEEIDWLTRSAIEYSSTDPLALSIRGHVESFVFHRFDRALDCFDRALQSNPSEPFCWAFSAVTLSYLGRTGEAIGRLHRYRELCPLDPYPFYFNTAFTLTYALAGEYAKAVEMGRRVVAENPNYFAAYRPLITSLARTGAIDEARTLLDKLLSNEPQFSIGWFRSKYPPLGGDRLAQYLKGFREVGVPEE
jgi:adenylate cyclase